MTAKSNIRAKKGGELGINGEWYDGGQYLPSSKYTIKGEQKFNKKNNVNKVRKIEIEPYKWIEVEDGQKSILSVYGAFMIFDWDNNTAEPTYNKKAYAHYNRTNEEIEAICKRWNNGERIV